MRMSDKKKVEVETSEVSETEETLENLSNNKGDE